MNELNRETVFQDELVEREYKFGWWKFILFFLTYLGFQTVLSVAGFIVYMMVEKPVITLENMEGVALEFATNPWMLYLDFVGFLLTVLIFKSTRIFLRGAFSFAPLRKLSTYLYLVAAFIFMYVSQYLILEYFVLESPEDTAETFNFASMTLNWLTVSFLIIGMGVLTGIKEEVLFRGVLHGFIGSRWGFTLGLLISSAIFGVLHLGYPITAGLMGVVFVVLYRVTGTLVTPIILHMVWNAYAVIDTIIKMNN